MPTYLMIWQRKKGIVAGNHEYKDTDSIHFRAVVTEVSSFVGNPVLFIFIHLKTLQNKNVFN